jgi:DNA-binding CsgD family transcriptional regulator
MSVPRPRYEHPYWVNQSAAAALGLRPRHLDVLRGLARGLTDADIGAELYLSRTTVKGHLRRLYAHLGVGDRAAAVALAYHYEVFRSAGAIAREVQRRREEAGPAPLPGQLAIPVHDGRMVKRL